MNQNELSQIINNLRRKNPEYKTNIYLPLNIIEKKIESGSICPIQTDDLLLLVEPDDDLMRVHFYARNKTAIKSIPSIIESQKYADLERFTIDIVGKDDQLAEMNLILTEAGMKHVYRFIRMSTKQPIFPKLKDIKVENATLEDLDEIIEILRTEFETIYSHFPTMDEFRQDCEKGYIQVIRDEGKIAAFSHYDQSSRLTHWHRYLITRPEARGKGFGNRLFRYAFEQMPENGMIYLWVGTYNKVIDWYHKLGYVHDGFSDDIYTLR